MIKVILSTLLFFSFSFAESKFNDHDLDKEEMLKVGARLYKNTCAACHGKNGETNREMELVVKPRKLQKTILTKEQSYQIIKHGAHHFGAHADIMPAFKYVYNNEQLSSLAYYISHSFNTQREAKIKKLLADSTKLSLDDKKAAMRVGKKIFQKKCALCHGINGNGESEYVEQSKADENFIYPYKLSRTLLDEDQIFLYAKFGGHYWGTDKDDMPSWKRKLNDVKLRSVAEYIQKEIKTMSDPK